MHTLQTVADGSREGMQEMLGCPSPRKAKVKDVEMGVTPRCPVEVGHTTCGRQLSPELDLQARAPIIQLSAPRRPPTPKTHETAGGETGWGLEAEYP